MDYNIGYRLNMWCLDCREPWLIVKNIHIQPCNCDCGTGSDITEYYYKFVEGNLVTKKEKKKKRGKK